MAGAADSASVATLAAQEERIVRDSAFLRDGDQQFDSIHRRLHQASGASATGSSFILVPSLFVYFWFHSALVSVG